MGLFNKEIELIVPPKKQNDKTIKVKTLNGYDAIREKVDENNTMTVKHPVLGKGPQPLETTKPKPKVSIGL